MFLDALRKPPYKPLADTTLKHLPLKPCFLVRLASARRSNDVHGLSGLPNDVAQVSDGSLTLPFLPECLATIQRPGVTLAPIHLRPLTTILAPVVAYRSLCPMRSLRSYLRRSRPLRSPHHIRLFVSFNPGFTRDISKPTLSRWVSTTIRAAAYRSLDVALPLDNPWAHEVRALSASLAASHQLPLHAILEAAFWLSEDSFIHFYLRDTSLLRHNGPRGIGSVVFAQHVLSSRIL